MLDLGIIIVNYNTRDLLRTCLRSVLASECAGSFRVCVVDNNSSDGSEQMVRTEFPGLRSWKAPSTEATPTPTTWACTISASDKAPRAISLP